MSIKKMKSSLAEADFNERRAIYQAQVLLNETPVTYNSKNDIFGLFSTALKVLENSSDRFKQTLQSSYDCYLDRSKIPDQIQNLQVNQSPSALIVPLNANNRIITAIVRKTEDGYSVVVPNKSFDKYEEYTVNNKRENGLINLLKKDGMENIEDYYQKLSKISTKVYPLKLSITDNLEKNCYFTGVKAAIKFVKGTETYSPEDLNAMRGKSLKVFVPQWGMKTSEFNGKYIENLKEQYPMAKNAMDDLNDIFLKNKQFRESMADGTQNTDRLIKTYLMTSEEKDIRSGLSRLNIRTLEDYGGEILRSLKEKYHEEPSLSRDFAAIIKLDKQKHELDHKIGGTEIIERLEKQYPIIVGQAKKDIAVACAVEYARCMSRGDKENAIKNVRASMQLNPESQMGYVLAADHYFQQKVLGKAEEYYTKAINAPMKDDSYTSACHEKLGYCAIYQQDFRKAISRFENLKETSPGKSIADKRIAECYYQLGEYDKAINNFKEYITKSPADVSAIGKLAYSYYAKNDFENAIATSKNLLMKNPESFEGHYTLGRCYSQKGNLNKAYQMFEKAVKIKPEHVHAQTEFKRCREDLGKVTDLKFNKTEDSSKRVLDFNSRKTNGERSGRPISVEKQIEIDRIRNKILNFAKESDKVRNLFS